MHYSNLDIVILVAAFVLFRLWHSKRTKILAWHLSGSEGKWRPMPEDESSALYALDCDQKDWRLDDLTREPRHSECMAGLRKGANGFEYLFVPAPYAQTKNMVIILASLSISLRLALSAEGLHKLWALLGFVPTCVAPLLAFRFRKAAIEALRDELLRTDAASASPAAFTVRMG